MSTMRMTTATAEDLLGLIGDYDEARVKAQAAARLKDVHPDLFEGGGDAAGQIERIKAAREKLLANLRAGGGGTMETCPRCKGKGVRPAVNGFGHEPCRNCDGDGLVKRRAI